jgi:hypothetical protein
MDEDTGLRPINPGAYPFWESPDLFMVPAGATVDLDGVSTESLVVPGEPFDVWVRVNNDFGCNPVHNAKALVYIADPSGLSMPLVPITSGQYLGSTTGANPDGVDVPAGGRALVGPFRFTSTESGHKCLMAAISAQNEPGPADTTNPLSSYQVAQRNVQFSDCQVPLTNATVSDGQLNLTLTASAEGGASIDLASDNLSLTLDDPGQVFYNRWLAKSGASTYDLSQAGGKTTVIMRHANVPLDDVTLAAGSTITGTAAVELGLGEPATTLRVGAVLKNSAGASLVANGVSCVGSGLELPGTGGTGGGGAGSGGASGAGGIIW